MPSPSRLPVHDGVRLGTTSRGDQALDPDETSTADAAVSVNGSVENGEPQPPTSILGWGSPGTDSTPLLASSTARRRASSDNSSSSSGSSNPTSLLLGSHAASASSPSSLRVIQKDGVVFSLGFHHWLPVRSAYTTTDIIPTAAAAPSFANSDDVEKGTLSSTTQHGPTYGDNDNGNGNKADSNAKDASQSQFSTTLLTTTGGENRFRPPKALPDSDQTFQAVRFGENCPIGGTVGKGFGENCLNANIYRPAGLVDDDGLKSGDSSKRPALLPVVVYIHGGAFNGGMGVERNMASFIAWADAPMIGINFNYRVCALGFLPSALTAKEGLLNLGLRDQTMMLEWVRENVKAFGGDPDNVTIMGLSAGAHSIGHHIMYYARKEAPAPFHRAILESGATTARAVLLPSHPRHLVQFREFLAAAGVDGAPEDQVFDQLRKLPLETIVKASKKVWDRYEPSVTWPFQPVIDGLHDHQQATSNNKSNSETTPVLIPDLPITSWRQGKHLRIPILTGFNTNEGAMFIPRNAKTNNDFRSFFKTLIPTLSDDDLSALEVLYPDPVTQPHKSPYRSVPNSQGAQWARLDAAYSHYAYICPVLQTAHFMSQAGLPVHVYRFAARGNRNAANHADEAPVVTHDMDFLRSLGPPGRGKGLRKVADGMNAAWGRFASGEKRIEVETDGKDGGKKVEWPIFRTPFGGDDHDLKKTAEKMTETERRSWSLSSLWKQISSSSDGDDDDDETKAPEGTGRMIVFGEGNNERAGGSSPGTPAKEEVLDGILLKACRFWWDRIELSEGLGKSREELGRDSKGARAKL
ncbi:Alpha/Beta hydrolase protein [Sordaria sp. MPI-SDFR-AT-0083]|nr:Alpha/Beta hydrolase protein [Sordaria sp. MPI-SDFR-AT-0083]